MRTTATVPAPSVFRRAFADSIPVMAGYGTMGFAAGVLLAVHGGIRWTALWAALSSAAFISGPLQYLFVDWVRTSLALGSVLLIVLCVNLRYSLYGLSLIETFRGARFWTRFYLIAGITDETYALEVACDLPPARKCDDVAFPRDPHRSAPRPREQVAGQYWRRRGDCCVCRSGGPSRCVQGTGGHADSDDGADGGTAACAAWADRRREGAAIMDSKTLYVMIVIVAVGALSWLIRALPFLLFGRQGEPPKTIAYVGRVLSPAAIAMLVVYCYAGYVRDRPPMEHLGMLAELVAGAVTVILHWRWRCPPLSIAVGTVLYMVLIRLF